MATINGRITSPALGSAHRRPPVADWSPDRVDAGVHQARQWGKRLGVAFLDLVKGFPLREILSRIRMGRSHTQASDAGYAAGIQGAIEVIGAAGLLQMCHLGRLTGTLEATHEARTIRMTFETGRLATAASTERRGREAVIDFLAWTDGRFAFQPGATAEGGPISETTEFLILDACRILDEKAARPDCPQE